ncbi:MAG: hypothetical protein H5T76_13865 [Streptomyces sp.]|nr:hypothetical protein [Streptomyces sp.]
MTADNTATATTDAPRTDSATAADAATVAVIGFDLGHGDTALTKVHVGTRSDTAALGDRNAPPEIIELGGDRKQLITAVAVTGDGQVLVGEAAVDVPGARTFVAFKSPDLEREETGRPLELFARHVVEEVRATRLTGAPAVRWMFGHPSGWHPDQVAAYQALLAEICAPDEVGLVPESRAALLYARDAGDVRESAKRDRAALVASTLIVDIGSSTTDYTWVVDGTGRPVDHGNVVLGAHLIDKALLKLAVDRSPDVRRLRAALADETGRGAAQTLEIAARKLKEKFFGIDPRRFQTHPRTRVRTTEEVFTADDEVLELTLTIDQDDMAAVLDRPVPALGDRSWKDAYREDLAAALRGTGTDVRTILLTGGPSRMGFVREITRELAPGADVVLGTEPEFAIARGLALAGRVDQRARGFRADVRQFLESGTVEALVEERLPRLTEKLAEAVTDGLTEKHLIPAFRAWKRRDVITIDDMCARVAAGVNAELGGGDSAALKAVMADWMAELRPELAQHTAVICRRWNLEPSALTLPEVTMSGSRMTVPVNTSAATDVLNNVTNLVNVVIAGVIATALLGHGFALLMVTGPFAVVVAAVAMFWGFTYVKEKIMEEIGDKDLPMAVRKLVREESMVRKLREQAPAQEAALATELAEQLRTGDQGRLAREITTSIERQLASVAADVELLIA